MKEKTLLGGGPMSFNVINAIVEVANENKIPLVLIASRRQVECSTLGGGYVADTKTFAEYVRKLDKGRYVFLARDHGGPWQGTNEEDLDYCYAIENSRKSYYSDIKNGFDIIHIDPSLRSRPIEKIIDDIKFLYRECEKYAKDFGKEVIYEAGTEEHSGNINSLEQFEDFVKEIKFSCPKVRFIVGNTGLWVKEDRNIGQFNEKQTIDLVRICNENGMFLKAHNCDYTEISFPSFGVHSVNIAPEFGVLETKTFLHSLQNFGLEKEYQDFVDLAWKSKRWQKWMVDDDSSRWLNDDEEKLFKAKLCGHYLFNDLNVKETKLKLNKIFPYDTVCKNAIKSCILSYLYNFRWNI